MIEIISRNLANTNVRLVSKQLHDSATYCENTHIRADIIRYNSEVLAEQRGKI